MILEKHGLCLRSSFLAESFEARSEEHSNASLLLNLTPYGTCFEVDCYILHRPVFEYLVY